MTSEQREALSQCTGVPEIGIWEDVREGICARKAAHRALRTETCARRNFPMERSARIP